MLSDVQLVPPPGELTETCHVISCMLYYLKTWRHPQKYRST